MLFKRFRIKAVLRMKLRQARRNRNVEEVEAITRALDSSIIQDEIDAYISDYDEEFGALGDGEILKKLLQFIIEHWEDILAIILAFVDSGISTGELDDKEAVMERLANECGRYPPTFSNPPISPEGV